MMEESSFPAPGISGGSRCADISVSSKPTMLKSCLPADVIMQRALVPLRRQDVIATLVDDLLGDCALTVELR
jgi:hypothetical protein